ncbi:MAG: GNAT family N-acetyltransferase [Sphingomonadaceae bacterium]|nr:GNAT family N-acetyltransferase [Sphingomonadaceae bacterium]
MAAIRRAGPADAETLAALKLATFRETFVEGFGIPYPPDDLAVFVAESYAADRVAAELADPERATWVAEDAAGRLLGYAQVGPCKLPHDDIGSGDGELYQLYTLREAQGLGLGRTLLNVALDHLAAKRPGRVWLGVWSGNLFAQRIYERRGFARVGGYGFPVGSWTDEEFIYRRD